MFKRFTCSLLLLLGMSACGARPQTTDLTARLNIAEKETDTQVIQFGNSQNDQYLSSGWSKPEKHKSGRLRWITGESASFSWGRKSEKPSFLHLRLAAQKSSLLEIDSDDRQIWKNSVSPDEHVYSLSLPVGAQQVTFRKSAGDTIGVYSAVITPSETTRIPRSFEYPLVKTLSVRHKTYPAWLSDTNGSVTFYEHLSGNDAIQFGYYFLPGLSESTATFRILIQPDRLSERIAFEKRIHSEESRFVDLSLRDFLPAFRNEPCRIRFEITRDSSFDSAKVAWLQPMIVKKQSIADDEELPVVKQLRENSRDANVVFILLDAASAKHFGCYGNPRNTTPVIDQLSKEGMLFQKAYTNAVYTLASTTTLFTGQLPVHHGILTHKNKLSPSAITLAETLQRYGFETAAFLTNGNSSEIFGLTQGFKTVEDVFRKKDYIGWGQELTDSFTSWLSHHSDKRFFAYLHYREPHEPYNPPEEWIHQFADPQYTGSVGKTFDARAVMDTNFEALSEEDRKQVLALYDANLAYADSQVGRVLGELKKAGIYDRTIIIVTADHGEAFWEHGYQGHNRQLYEESARIPLILKFPGNSELAGKRTATVYQIADLYPSLLDLLQVPMPHAKFDGASFLRDLTRNSKRFRAIPIRSTQASTSAIVWNGYKLIVSPGGIELYDLQKDPHEKQNLSVSRPVLAGYLRQCLAELSVSEERKPQSEEAVLDQETQQNLRALGYLN